ncbi:DegT/DnrJ/EryC1/StrS family aminotransferase [Bradyrhizobium manausense]|uniref:DegT/DnrJ/EryC1/StrS family aminotransferase n=1 Tax=Bradyrhizobium TaxID=374 RepID=UPI001BAB91E2|nr:MULTISPECIES: DegT/DnrJ/EryC1/StrS family aminotransferase [Bradyrhizobium]MBR0829715.1 DegT/DnrJ/EryC1/StrS family aminotransferase [Bradyrhizobium manausense]UVO25328.1 DegT/DnrJ/EryC1/StrS family aminotransferase [Bradyrhizobium arachidis]
MSEFHIPMSQPDITERDIEAVTRVLRSGRLSIGPCIDEFEEAVRNYVGTRYAIAVASGTAGLHLCMRAAKAEDGAEVITSPYSFIASANCILYERGRPVFVDIDEDSFNIDPDAVEAALTDRTTALLPVHVFGRSARMDRICRTADRRGLTVVEDACEAIGAEFAGRKVGTFGKAAVFAFYPNKQMTTGEGGIIVTDDPNWDRELRALRNHGRAGNEWLEHHHLGFNYRLNEMSAALGLSQISRIEDLLARRARVAETYGERLAHIAGVRVLTPTAGATRMSWFVYIVRLESGMSRDNIAARMGEMGIPTRHYFPPIHLQPFFVERYGYKRGQFPVTERVSASTLALPFHTNMPEQAVDRVCRALQTAIDEETRLSA